MTSTVAAINESNDAIGPNSPSAHVGDLDSRTYSSNAALVEDIVRSMKVSGACIVRQLLRQDALDAIEKEVRPSLDTAKPWRGEPKSKRDEHRLSSQPVRGTSGRQRRER